MKAVKVKAIYRKLLADTLSPVSIYLRLRDRFPGSLLLEAGDYHGAENSYSFVCCDPIANFEIKGGLARYELADGSAAERAIASRAEATALLRGFCSSIEVENLPEIAKLGIANGYFGYISYDAVELFEEIDLSQPDNDGFDIPEIRYSAFRYIFAINHFKSELFLIENVIEGAPPAEPLGQIEYLATQTPFPLYPFRAKGEERANLPDAEFCEVVEKCKAHIARGDVFQIVPSRRFYRDFRGDEFNVYRALRSINPSPYLFYFDYGSFKIFGSSPEAQILIKGGVATIAPIAGTYRRSGDESRDLELAQGLADDPKENAEHVMLVDLARNDLSKHCRDVAVTKFKEIQFYSHVIHLVSKVSGKLKDGVSPLSVLADTFPAGTLTGAPKHRAMQLIDRYERGRRRFYGGGLGIISFNGDCNHAIIIRSFLSKDNVLAYQAGAGIVFDSIPENEAKETANKLAALRSALSRAEELA